ncbi:major facilitator superfamily-domain-containing protein [Rhodocollybia butyracea]|uniref:Major facilitator superfamily-domain-containing protein n=1 Tax=Rhodocollybia butyracea TaxID=206335 RepID=A0A9P5P7B8_9AGAR|nr:major facilitator superfamily-domain-containing protein [Rhodocollybia butyracea]
MTEPVLAELKVTQSTVILSGSNTEHISPDPTKDEADVQYPLAFRRAVIILGICLALFAVGLDNTIIGEILEPTSTTFSKPQTALATVIPTITTVFNSIEDVGWYGAAYLLAVASLQPTFGKLYTVLNFQPETTVFDSCVHFRRFDSPTLWITKAVDLSKIVGSIICATSTSSLALIIGRAVAGIGASAIMSGSFNIIVYLVALEKQPVYISSIMSVYSAATICGPFLGGAFTEKISWRWSFWINVPIGAITFLIVAIFFSIPQKASSLTFKEKMVSLDFFGALFFIGAMICLLLALQFGGTVYRWSDSRVWGLFLGFVLMISIFAFIQTKRGKQATMPVSILKKRTVIIATLYNIFYCMAFFTYTYYLPLYFQAVKHTSVVGSGTRFVPFLLSGVISSIAFGWFVTYTGYYHPFLWIGSIIFIVGGGLLSSLHTTSSVAQWLVYEIISGVGSGPAQLPFVAVQAVLSPDLIMLTSSLGGAISLAVSQTIFSNEIVKQVKRYAPSIDPSLILRTGATHFHDVLPAGALGGVVQAYSQAIQSVFIPPIIVIGLSLIVGLGIERLNLKNKKQSATKFSNG